MVETDRVVLTKGKAQTVHTPSASGKGQDIVRCPSCRVALWSHYPGAGKSVAFLRVGTLDEGHDISPDIHIFTSTKQPWVVLGEDVPIKSGYYNRDTLWPKDALARRAALGS